MQVVKCQTKIRTVIGDIPAIVTGICIRNESVTYEISYFNSGVFTSCWINRYEFIINTQEKKKAGLVNYDKINENENYNSIILINKSENGN